MPRKDIHDMWEMDILGKLTGMTEVMDSMAPVAHSHHREYFHDEEQVLFLAVVHAKNSKQNPEDCFLAGLIHLMVDEFQDSKFEYERRNSVWQQQPPKAKQSQALKALLKSSKTPLKPFPPPTP